MQLISTATLLKHRDLRAEIQVLDLTIRIKDNTRAYFQRKLLQGNR
ncbi:hypothetical protein [Psychromonas aquimarina]|nr:hypothetical protein [Psychromonas aquimarina]